MLRSEDYKVLVTSVAYYGIPAMARINILTFILILGSILSFTCKKGYAHFPNNVEPSIKVNDFNLPSQTGENFGFYDILQGKRMAIIFFGYSHCPDICKNVLKKLSLVIVKLTPEERRQIAFVFVSVDSARDSKDHIMKFLYKFDPEILGLYGDSGKLVPILENFGVVSSELIGRSGENLIGHSTELFWVDQKGFLVKKIPDNFEESELLDEIRTFR